MNGWVKLHRKITDHAVWSLPDAHLKIWITILCLVNHKTADWWDGSQRIEIEPGSFITSQDHLASESKTSRQSVRAALTNLIRICSISTKITTKKYTQIFVTNWTVYSGDESLANQEDNQSPTKSQPRANQEPTITGECKKEKNVRKKILLANPEGFAAFWVKYPKKVGKAAAEKAWHRLNPQNGLVEQIVRSVEDHKKSLDWQKEHGKYIPFPATFLNGRRWEDELPEPTVCLVSPAIAQGLPGLQEWMGR